MNQNFSNNYWLGGYWTGGTLRGANWLRGRWSGGSWQKGNFYSVDLTNNYTGIYQNNWSIWTGGIWRSNSQDYTFTSNQIDNEWSVWHGGIWQSQKYDRQLYNWQGPFINETNIYGELVAYDCDIPVGNAQAKRSIFLPSPRSLWLGGQWLRGDFQGGIFACGMWHSVKWNNVEYTFFNDLFFLYGSGSSPLQTVTQVVDGIPYLFILNDNENLPFEVYLYNDNEFNSINISTGYDENSSRFFSGAFVNSIWEGGTVMDTNVDSYNTLFGMALSSDISKIRDDSGFSAPIGFLESNTILKTRVFGLNMIDYNTYYNNSTFNTNDQILNIRPNSSYFMPNNFESGGIYSVIWKRGKFLNGTFNYGQWYDYDELNQLNSEYSHDLNIQNNFNDLQSGTTLPINWSVFKKGLFYNSIWVNGIWLTSDNNRSAFSRSRWMTGYWALGINNSNSFTENKKISNTPFFKSAWYSGIWEGGKSIMSTFTANNPFNFNLTLNGNVITNNANSNSVNFFDNIINNPLGKIDSTVLNYYDVNGNNTTEFNNFIADMGSSDMLKNQSVYNFDYADLIKDTAQLFVEFEGNPVDPDPGPYDFYLGDASSSGFIYLFNDTEFRLNSDIINQRYLRYTGLVDNYATVWYNGTAEGSIWNGGIWLTGQFKPYTFSNYPNNIPDRRNPALNVQLDWFDDNVINNSTEISKLQHSIWMRGLWYGGYFRAGGYMLSVPAYVNDSSQNIFLDNNYKLLVSDDIVTSEINSNFATILQFKNNNMSSIFARKTVRDADVAYFSQFNGQMLGGVFYDINKDGLETPSFATITYPEDITYSNNIGPTFGLVSYDRLKNPDAGDQPINTNTSNTSWNIKNTAESPLIDLVIAEPFAYDNLNNQLAYNLTNSQYINLYYYNSVQTIVFATGNDSNYDIRHAALNGNQPKWTDILPVLSASTRVPSQAQGSEETEPYYEQLPPLWIDSGI